MRISDWSSDVCSSDLSLTSYNDFQRKALSDWRGAPYEILLQKADGRIKSFAQEIHFEGEAGRVNWLVGGYYGNAKIVYSTRQLTGENAHARFIRAEPSLVVPGVNKIDIRSCG